MSWKLLCDRCDEEIKNRDGEGQTVFKRVVDNAPTDDGLGEAEFTIHVRINGDHTHLCMNCIKNLLGIA